MKVFSTPVINLIGGPGCGKSTMMTGLFNALKQRSINAEMSPEWFKGKVWEGTAQVLANDQTYVTAKQNHQLARLMDCGVKVAITDCPLILGTIYGKEMPLWYNAMCHGLFDQYNNVVVFLERCKPYETEGRFQTEEEAKVTDEEVLTMLVSLSIPHIKVSADMHPSSLLDVILCDAGGDWMPLRESWFSGGHRHLGWECVTG